MPFRCGFLRCALRREIRRAARGMMISRRSHLVSAVGSRDGQSPPRRRDSHSAHGSPVNLAAGLHRLCGCAVRKKRGGRAARGVAVGHEGESVVVGDASIGVLVRREEARDDLRRIPTRSLMQGRRDSNPRPTVLEYAAGRLGYAETGSDAPGFAPAPRCRSSSSAHQDESSGDKTRAVVPSRAGVRGAA